MELSVRAPDPELCSAAAASRLARSTAASDRLEIFDVALPTHLRQFGDSIRASALGDPANPAVVVLGGISANCFPAVRPDGAAGWWSGLVGQGCDIDPAQRYIIGVDFAADESGKQAPSTYDQAQVVAAALDRIGVSKPCDFVGASYGGMVGLALAESQPERLSKLIVVSAAAGPHPAATAARELQRRVVALGLETGRGEEALAIARGMAMLTYRTPVEFAVRFEGGIDEVHPTSCSGPGAYLRARGQAFLSVMSPGRFLSLSASIDRHRIRPDRITTRTLLIGADSDQLVYPDQIRSLADKLAGPRQIHILASLFGHDMFLKEAERVGRIVGPFLAAQA